MDQRAKIFMALVGLVLLSVSAATATSAQKNTGQFTQMDQDKNGLVTWEELKRFHPGIEQSSFKAADANQDGVISHDEWYTYKNKPRMGRHEKAGDGYGQGKGLGKRKDMGKNSYKGTLFGQWDTDSNQLLSYAELKAQVATASVDQFKQADTNGDGMLDHGEWARSRDQFGHGVGRGPGKDYKQ